MKRMLINATQPEEIRVALVDGQTLYDLDIESRQRDRLKDSIYKGRVARVEPSLQAAFVEIGESRQAFLPLKAVSPEYLTAQEAAADQEKRNLSTILKPDQEIMVQVEKEERGNKGAAVTSYVAIAGRYVVLMPNNPRGGGISRRIEGEEREVTRELLGQLELPNGMGLIIRTGGVGRSVEELQWDLDHLLQIWGSVKAAAEQRSAPALLFRDSDLMGRAIRDYLSPDIGEILVDDEEAFATAREFVTQMSPNLVDKVKRYDQKVPLFSYFQIESQIESAYRHRVSLPSGGSIVIERTEALVAVDVNSGRSTAGSDIEETALNTNLEAVVEVAKQLRLRDIGGIVVLDLIDMSPLRNRQQVEQAMEEALASDRARTQVQRISRFGLLEMTRERLGASLEETSTGLCPRCSGQGRIRDVPSTALSILRLSEEEALKRESSVVRARVPLEVGTFLLNEKRGDLAEIEQRTKTHLVIVPTAHFETPHFEIERIRESDAAKASETPSYELMESPPPPDPVMKPSGRRDKRPAEPAVVAAQRTPSPIKPGEDAGLFSKVKKSLTSLFGNGEPEEAPEPKSRTSRSSGKKQPQRGRRDQSSARSGNGNRGRSQARSSDGSNRDQDRRRGRGERGQGQSKAKAPGRESGQERAARGARGAAKQDAQAAPKQAKPRQRDPGASDASSTPDQAFAAPAEGTTKRKPRRSRSRASGRSETAPQAQASVPVADPNAMPVADSTEQLAGLAEEQVSASASQPVQESPSVVNEPVLETFEAVATRADEEPEAAEDKPSEVAVDTSSVEAEQAAKVPGNKRRKRPNRRPEIKASSPPDAFELETTEVSVEPVLAQTVPTPPPETPQESSIRLSNDPRAGKSASSSGEFEVEQTS